MKKVKQFVLAVAFTTLVGVALAGCGAQQPTPPEQPKETANVETATYVGTETCNYCHAEETKAVANTGHGHAFKQLSDFPTSQPLGEITIYDSSNTASAVSTKIDLSKAKVYGVMMNEYVVAEIPKEAGFKNDTYRVAKLEKEGDKYKVVAAGEKDMNKDGNNDWTASNFSCGACHAPGVGTDSPDAGISCESCHGPGSIHVSAEDKKGTMEVSEKACVTCHNLQPSKDAQGNYTTQNHYGTRNYFTSVHYESNMGCLTCHTTHKANANGQLLKKDDPAAICNTCHSDYKVDANILSKMMWKNPTDAHGHITSDHSFGAVKYEDLGDDPATKPVEIKNQKVIDMIKKSFPNL